MLAVQYNNGSVYPYKVKDGGKAWYFEDYTEAKTFIDFYFFKQEKENAEHNKRN